MANILFKAISFHWYFPEMNVVGHLFVPEEKGRLMKFENTGGIPTQFNLLVTTMYVKAFDPSNRNLFSLPWMRSFVVFGASFDHTFPNESLINFFLLNELIFTNCLCCA